MTDTDASAKRLRVLFFVVLGAAVLFRMWFAATIPLSGDEAYHWEWSRHLAAGYYDHPPLTAFLIRLSTELFRVSTELSVRLPAILLLAGTALLARAYAVRLVLCRGASGLQAERAGFWAGILLLAVSVFSGSGMYMSTDPPAIFFWTLSLYLFDRALVGARWIDWVGAGAAVGLAILGKFLAVFFIPAAGIAVLFCPRARKYLVRPQPYLAALAGVVVCAPFLYWNAKHDWATFMFNFVYRHEARAFTWDFLGESLLGQVLGLSPGIWIIAVAAIVWGMREALRSREEGVTLLVATALCPHAYFVYASMWRRVSVHWPMVGWVAALILVAVVWGETGQTARRWRIIARRVALVVCLLLTVSVHALVRVPPRVIGVLVGSGSDAGSRRARWAYEKFGWDEIGARVEAVREGALNEQDPGGAGFFILCDEYGLAADIAFYTPSQFTTHLWAPRRKHGENYRFWDDFRQMRGQDAVLVSKRLRSIKRALPSLREHFESVGDVEEVPISAGGQVVRSFFIVCGRRFNGIPPEFAGASVH